MKDYLDRFIELVKNNTNGVGEVVRLGILMLMLFEIIHWTDAQMFGFLGFISAIMALITSKTTVPANRIDQKVDAKVAHREAMNQMGTGAGLVEPGVGPGTGSGVFKPPTTLLVLALAGSLLVAGCASGMHGAAKAEDVAHDGLMAFDRMLDARCDAGEITAPTCKELNQLLVPVWDIKNNLNRTIAGGTSAVTVRLDQFQAAVKVLIAKVTELVQGGAKELLLRELNLASTQGGK